MGRGDVSVHVHPVRKWLKTTKISLDTTYKETHNCVDIERPVGQQGPHGRLLQ